MHRSEPCHTPKIHAQGVSEVVVLPEHRTATATVEVNEKDRKKSDEIIDYFKAQCQKHSIKIGGSKANLGHDIKSGGFFRPGKEVAKLTWHSYLEGTNTNIGKLSEALFEKFKATAPKIDFVDEDPKEAELEEAEQEAVDKASVKAKERAARMAKAFNVTLGKLAKVSFDCHKMYDTSHRDDFDHPTETLMMDEGFSAKRAVAMDCYPPSPPRGRQIVKMMATVHCEYEIVQ